MLPMNQNPRSVSELEITGLVGSLRVASSCRIVMDTMVDLLDGQVRLRVPDIRSVPPFDQDLEESAIPPVVSDLKDAVRSSDAVLIVTPEYNWGIPGHLKNVLDWVSRPFPEGPFHGRAIGVVSAAAHPGTGDHVRARLSETMGVLGRAYPETLSVPSVESQSLDGRIVDPATRHELQEWLNGFLAWARASED